jgi:hypothetical protein
MSGPTVRTLLLRCMMVRLRWSPVALLLLALWISFLARPCSAFASSSSITICTMPTKRIRTCSVGENGSKEESDSNEDLNLEGLESQSLTNVEETIDGQPLTADNAEPALRTSSVRIDDGGSDLTDRFKYKVSPYRE